MALVSACRQTQTGLRDPSRRRRASVQHGSVTLAVGGVAELVTGGVEERVLAAFVAAAGGWVRRVCVRYGHTELLREEGGDVALGCGLVVAQDEQGNGE